MCFLIIQAKKETEFTFNAGDYAKYYDWVDAITFNYEPQEIKIHRFNRKFTFAFFLLLDEPEISFFAGGLARGSGCLRFLLLKATGVTNPAPSWRKLSFSGVPVLAMAARDRIISVWAAMLMLFSLPASLAGLQEGRSGVAGGTRGLGVPSPSLPSL